MKNVDQVDEDDMVMLSAKERLDLSKFKVSEIKRQMKDSELKEKMDLQQEKNLTENVKELSDFKILENTKKLKWINDVCNEIIKSPKTDLDKLALLNSLCDNRILEDKNINKIALCSMTLILNDITPD